MASPPVDVDAQAASLGTPVAGRRRGLAAVAVTAFNLRTAVTGFAVLATAAGDDLGFGPVVTGAIGTIVTACFAVAAFAAPAVARRLGLERTAALAVGLTTVGVLVRAAAWSPAALIAGTVIAFAGVGGCNVVLIPIVKQRFPGSVKSVSTLYMVLLQVGQLTAPLVAVALTGPFGWRVSAGVWAVLTLPAAALWASLVRRPDAPGAVRPQAVTASPTPRSGSVWRRPVVWGLVGLMAMTTLHTYTLVTWLPTMFEDAGLSAATGAALLSWFAGLGIIAAFVVPPLAHRMENPFAIVVACVALMAVGYAGMATAPAGGAALWALTFGLGVSTFPLCLTLIGARAADAGASTTLSGIVQGIGYGVGCVGPIALGALNQATDSWQGAYATLGGTLLVTLVSGWFACRPAAASPIPARS